MTDNHPTSWTITFPIVTRGMTMLLMNDQADSKEDAEDLAMMHSRHHGYAVIVDNKGNSVTYANGEFFNVGGNS